jgi:DNA-binding NtrC family response regulator
MRKNEKILVADDDPGACEILDIVLKEWGYDTALAYNGQEALAKAQAFRPSIVISDVRMPKLDGLELVRALKQSLPYCVVILVTAHVDIELAVKAVKEGAIDYIIKPVDHHKLKELIERTLEQIAPYARAAELDYQLGETKKSFGRLVGTTSMMKEIYALIKHVAPSKASVMITGESGTGKELVARTIHELSPRNDKPFIAINSSAIPETLIESEIFGHEKGAFTGALETRVGCFEMANKGTLFLDEIAEMPLLLQPKLLRVLEDGKVRRLGGKQEFDVDVRIVAATNRETAEALKKGSLREDLFYRLNVFTIKLPALRERKEDIPLLAQHFINDLNRKYNLSVKSISPQTEDLLVRYSWPGNVRELRNVIERSMLVCKGDLIQPLHLPPYYREPQESSGSVLSIPVGKSLKDIEELIIRKTLDMTRQNKAEAARILGVDVKTIRNKLKSFGIADDERPEEAEKAT